MYHPTLEQNLQISQSIDSLDSIEYRNHLLKRTDVKIAVYQAMVENGIDVLVFPSVGQKPTKLGELQSGNNCKLGSNSGLPAITIPAGFTSDGLPVGLELLGREWDEPKLLKYAYAYEQATNHRQVPASTPAL